MKGSILSIILLWIMSLHITAQTITNVVAKQVGNTVEIIYDLDMPAYVSLEFSRDGGKTYEQQGEISLRPSNNANFFSALSGDIGQTTSGHKKIMWNLFMDGVDWEIPQATFKVIARKLQKVTFTINGVSFDMIYVEGGSCYLGLTTEQGKKTSQEKESYYETLEDYYIGITEVTQALWTAVMGTTIRQELNKTIERCNPDEYERRHHYLLFGEGDNYPMYYLDWYDCCEFVQKLNSLLSSEIGPLRFSIPSISQWEYAARGGKKQGSVQFMFSGSDDSYSVAWSAENSNRSSHLVASKKPNKLGLYDMSGNVAEWCQDRSQVLRGGSWTHYLGGCKVSSQNYYRPEYKGNAVGMRLVLQLKSK